MAKINIADLAAVLIEKHGLERREAAFFTEALLQTIHYGLEKDKILKIKGLGTFKIVEVNARESVNVNSGERVLIEGHQKLSFTPDASMKELVNKPFSQFETVVLNDGVEFDDMPTDEPATVEEPETTETPVADVEPAKTDLVAEKETAVEEPQVIVEPKVVEIPQVEENSEVVEPTAVEKEESPSTVALVSNASTEAPVAEKFFWLWIIIAAISGLIIGFFFGRATSNDVPSSYNNLPVADVENLEKVPSDSLSETNVAPTDTLQTPIASTDSMVTKVNSPLDSLQTTQEKQPTTEVPAFDSNKFEEMDGRVRYGAYRIIGIQETVKARGGETVKQLSRRYLGPDMECYVEVLNGLKGSDILKSGQEIKIPKLEWKKKKSKH